MFSTVGLALNVRDLARCVAFESRGILRSATLKNCQNINTNAHTIRVLKRSEQWKI